MDIIRSMEHQLENEKKQLLDRMPSPDIIAEWCMREYDYVECTRDRVLVQWGFNKLRARVMGAYILYDHGMINVGIFCGNEHLDADRPRDNLPRVAATLRETISSVDDVLEILDKKYSQDCILFGDDK